MAQKKKKGNVGLGEMVVGVLILLVFWWAIQDADEPTNHQNTPYEAVTEVTQIESPFAIYVWDVGQADSILVTCDGKNMLIDAGNNSDGKLIVKQLEEMGIHKIDYLIGTHPHEDHIGGLDNIIENFSIGKIMMPNREADSMTFESVLDAAIAKNKKITLPKEGTTFSLGSATCQLLSANSEMEDVNDSSIVIEVTYGAKKFLFTGDITSTLERQITWEKIDVLKVAHHGSRYSTSESFLQATKPQIALISCGPNNDYDHPHQETLQRLQDFHCQIYRTDIGGTICVTSDGKKIQVQYLSILLDGNKR